MGAILTFAAMMLMFVNDGCGFEIAVKRFFGFVDAFVSSQNRADLKLYRNGRFIGSLECKSGCGTLSPVPLEMFKRMAHCNFVCYIPRYNNPNDLKYARVLSYKAFINLLEKHDLIRNVPIGSKRGGGYKTGCKNFLPSNCETPKPFDGLKAGREFIEEFYEMGETLIDFAARLGIDEIR